MELNSTEDRLKEKCRSLEAKLLKFKKYERIEAEIERSNKVHPVYPVSIFEQLAIMQEEAGEVTKAVLDYKYDGGSINDIEKELIQTAAMCMKMLKAVSYMIKIANNVSDLYIDPELPGLNFKQMDEYSEILKSIRAGEFPDIGMRLSPGQGSDIRETLRKVHAGCDTQKDAENYFNTYILERIDNTTEYSDMLESIKNGGFPLISGMSFSDEQAFEIREVLKAVHVGRFPEQRALNYYYTHIIPCISKDPKRLSDNLDDSDFITDRLEYIRSRTLDGLKNKFNDRTRD